jgi:hypothetical protein
MLVGVVEPHRYRPTNRRRGTRILKDIVIARHGLEIFVQVDTRAVMEGVVQRE